MIRYISLGVIVLLLTPVAWSYGHALTHPGTDSVGLRTIEWTRQHGGSRFVAWAENTWYSHHAPKKGGAPKTLPTVVSPVTTAPSAPTQTPVTAPPPTKPTNVVPFVEPALPGEGVWQPNGRTTAGFPGLYTTFIRPDTVHTSLTTGLAWMDPKLLSFTLYSGSEEPGGEGWHNQAPIPADRRPTLAGAFNSGFKLVDSHGGYYAEGRTVKPLVNGKASMVTFVDGELGVGQWGRDFTMSPYVASVRQNLILLVDHGAPVPEVDHDSLTTWGFTVKNEILVWRSGVGVDANGHVIWAGGNGLSVRSLAEILVRAGAVRAMELDINSSWVRFFAFHDDPNSPGATAGSKLLPDMQTPADRYFAPSTRDFVTASVRDQRILDTPAVP